MTHDDALASEIRPNESTDCTVNTSDVFLKSDTPKQSNGYTRKEQTETRRRKSDKGWSWVILFASFFNYIVVSAIWYSFSVLYGELVDHFQMSKASIGVLASVEAASLHFTGAFCSGLVEKYGSRPVAMIGSFIAAAALFGGAFTNNLNVLYAVYGIAGAGIGLSYVSFVVIIQQYFGKRRTMASGFTLTGFSIASFSLPPLTRWLVDTYGWRGTLMMISGFYLNGIVLAALLRPPPKPSPAKPGPRVRTRSFSQKLTRQMSFEKTKSRFTSAKEICRKVLDYKMLADPKFVLYGFGTMFMMIGNIAFFMHLINRAESLGIEPHRATFLPSIYGIANGVCRLVFSVLANLPKSYRTIQYGVWIFAGGFISAMSTFATDFTGLAIVCAGFGMCVGAFICIQYPALVDLLGVKKIARSTGLLQLFIGVAGLVATPLAGWVYDVTGDYNIPYFSMGAIMMLGGAIILIIPCLDLCRQPHHITEDKVSEDLKTSASVGKIEKCDAVTSEDEEAQIGNQDSMSCPNRLRTVSSTSYLQARV